MFQIIFFPVLDMSESVSSGSRSSNSAFHLPKRILVEEWKEKSKKFSGAW